MCRLLFRDGRVWAENTVQEMRHLDLQSDGLDQLIEIVKRGTVDKPPAYAQGVQSLLDEILALKKSKPLRRKGLKADQRPAA